MAAKTFDGAVLEDPMLRADYGIVLIEDDQGLREALERVLRSSGYDVVALGSGEELQLLLGNTGFPSSCRCVICDVRLPGIGGFELRRRAAELAPLPPWIYISAFDDVTTRRQVEREGADFLQKPFPGKTLLALVASHSPPGRT
ncbi:response regulator [Pseudoxanthomonas sp. 3HH-4]|uniref:response regulator n=1 Tax=Pseudoxanthomonas sp. 3HH-4 TaxID=1690214 RepID=UPI001C8A3729|nr:response regulator [Pseudoxanthomonas sp. 3HH-4]